MAFELNGRISADNAGQIERELLDKKPDVIDASGLTYISSAGLRALLKYAQSLGEDKPKVRIVDVEPSVYEIFDQTGFTAFFDVEKKLREVSAEGCQMLGRGYCATVYKLDSERIIKVYDAPRHAHDLSLVRNDREISKKVFMLGLPCLISFEVAVCDGYYAGIYELINGDTLGNEICKDPGSLERYIKELADIGRRMNGITVDEGSFPPNRTLTRRKNLLEGRFTEEEMAAFDSLIDTIPDRRRLVHGDFHVENMMVQDGKLVMIDVGGFSEGYPLIDLLCLFMKTREPEYLKNRLSDEQNRQIWECYLKYYFEGRRTEESRASVDAVLSLFADMFMLPTACALDSESEIELRKGRILQMTPEVLRKHIEVIDTILYR